MSDQQLPGTVERSGRDLANGSQRGVLLRHTCGFESMILKLGKFLERALSGHVGTPFQDHGPGFKKHRQQMDENH